MRTDAGTRRGLRDTPLGKAALLIIVLLIALLVSRSCGSSQPDVTKEEAIEIAKREVSYEPDGVQIRNVGQGVPAERRIWAVSLYTGRRVAPDRLTVVEIDAESGRVVDLHGPRS